MWRGAIESVRLIKIRQTATQIVSLGTVLTTALMIWKLLIWASGSDSPVVVVLTGSMEPGFKRGDVLFLHKNRTPVRAGEVIVFKVQGRDIPIVHRVVKVHQHRDTSEIDLLTKGDNNEVDDSQGRIYADGQQWLRHHHVMGKVFGYAPQIGWATIILTEKPIIKYLLVCALGLLSITPNWCY